MWEVLFFALVAFFVAQLLLLAVGSGLSRFTLSRAVAMRPEQLEATATLGERLVGGLYTGVLGVAVVLFYLSPPPWASWSPWPRAGRSSLPGAGGVSSALRARVVLGPSAAVHVREEGSVFQVLLGLALFEGLHVSELKSIHSPLLPAAGVWPTLPHPLPQPRGHARRAGGGAALVPALQRVAQEQFPLNLLVEAVATLVRVRGLLLLDPESDQRTLRLLDVDEQMGHMGALLMRSENEKLRQAS